MVSGDVEEDPFCYYTQFIIPSLFMVGLVMMAYLLYAYIRAYQQDNIKSSAFLFWTSLIYFVLAFLYYFVTMMVYVFECRNNKISVIFLNISAHLYGVQTLTIAAILFARLVIIFKGTSFRVSDSTVNTISVLISSTLVISTSGQILYHNTSFDDIGLILLYFGSFGLIIVASSLNILFIHKILRVYRMTKKQSSKSHNLLNLITKKTVLCFASTWTTFVFLLIYFLRIFTNRNPHYYFFMVLCLMADTYINFMAIFLSFNHFDNLYIRVCGCCDKRCHTFWKKRVSSMQLEMVTHSSTAGTTNSKL